MVDDVVDPLCGREAGEEGDRPQGDLDGEGAPGDVGRADPEDAPEEERAGKEDEADLPRGEPDGRHLPLTDEIEARARELIERIDALGGAMAAIEQGFQQREIQEASYRYQMEVERGERIIVGVNRFQTEEPPPEGLLRVDPRVGERQKAKLAKIRAERDPAKVAALLQKLEETARGTANTMPVFIECVEHYITIGEICDVLRRVWGEQKEFAVY